MKTAWTLLALVTALFLVAGVQAADTKEVTLTGKIMCARCELKEAKKCQTVIKVKEDGKEVTYYFLDKGHGEKYHSPVCGGGQKEGKVTGTVSTKDGKKWITPKKVTYTEK
jgi:hypothetical protein